MSKFLLKLQFFVKTSANETSLIASASGFKRPKNWKIDLMTFNIASQIFRSKAYFETILDISVRALLSRIHWIYVHLSADIVSYQRCFTMSTCATSFSVLFMWRNHLLPDRFPGEYLDGMPTVLAFLLQRINPIDSMINPHCFCIRRITDSSAVAIRWKYGGWVRSDCPHLFFSCAPIT